MMEVGVAMLQAEILRLKSIVTQSRMFHHSGLKLHNPGAVLGPAEIKAMQDVAMRAVYFLEPGEGERVAQRILTTELKRTTDLQVDDVLEEDARASDGTVVCRSGTALDPQLIRTSLQQAYQVTIRKRGLALAADQAKAYLARIPPPPPRPPRPDSRVTQVIQPGDFALRSLVVPQARVFLAMRDEFQRTLVGNLLASHGHDLVGAAAVVISGAEFQTSRPDILVIDVEVASTFLPAFRKSEIFRNLAVLVTAPEGRKAEVYRALTVGANGSVPIPPRRDALLEKVRGTLSAFGRATRIAPVVQTERRTEAREPGQFVCGLVDRFLKTELPVPQATIVDIGEGGLRIEYPVPKWPVLHAYLSHGVHPQHGHFNYAKENPLGRDLTVTLPPAAGKSMEIQAKFVHVSLNGAFETAGLVFHRVRGSVRDHVTTFRAIKPSGAVRPTQTRPF